jgi:hypothetical protein
MRLNLADNRKPPANILEIDILEKIKRSEGKSFTSTAIAKRYNTSM